MRVDRRKLMAGVAASTLLPAAAFAQETVTIADLAKKAEGESLVIALQQDEGFQIIAEEFQKKFPKTRVESTVSAPSQLAPRIVTEQRNGVYAWDVWWATASNMNSVVAPIGGFEDITAYLLLPEVKDMSKWRNTDYLYPSQKGTFVFLHAHFLQTLGLYNTDKVPGGVIKSVKDILDPALKGKITIRVPSRPHGGSMMIAAMGKEQGMDFVKQLMTDMAPRFVDNDRQISQSVMSGEAAVGIGTAEEVYTQCVAEGGCKNVMFLPISFLHSLGIGVLKNAPHKNAAKLWINWLLSQEGQTAFIKAWSRNPYVAASNRVDVAPDPKKVQYVPDFAHLEKYVAVSFDSGAVELGEVAKIYASVRK